LSDHRGRTLLLSRLISIRDVSMNNYGKSSFARLNRGVVVLKSFIALIKSLMNNVNDVRKRRKMCIRTHNRSNLNNSSSLRDLFLVIVSRFPWTKSGLCLSIKRYLARLFSPYIALRVIITHDMMKLPWRPSDKRIIALCRKNNWDSGAPVKSIKRLFMIFWNGHVLVLLIKILFNLR